MLNRRSWCLFLVVFFSVLLGLKLQTMSHIDSTTSAAIPTQTPIRVGFSQIETDNPWRTAQINSFREALGPVGMEFVYHEPEEYTASWQAQDILSLIQEHVDYLVVVPADAAQLTPSLKKAKEAGVPVILIGQDTSLIDSSVYVSRIMTDYRKEGEICARMLKQKYGDQLCNIVELFGSENSPAALARSEGFHREIEQYTNFHIIDTEHGDFNRVTAQKAMENALIQASNKMQTIHAVFAHSDEDGLGALQAIKVAGISPGELSIVSINGIQDVCKAIIAGEYLGTVESNPKWGQIVLILINQMERDSRPFPVVIIPYRIVNADNAAEYSRTAY
ncbi:MAG: ABC transporter substrate-binding protein [Lachnospiraceae bacterium]|nr:ABC transporter substrate-binding protein [Lachnospiraceae bacterium]